MDHIYSQWLVFDWNNKQNGALIGSIGVISALLQGGYVRRAMSKVGEGKIARQGITSCAVGLVLLAILPHALNNYPTTALRLLQGAAVCMAMTSATVVNALTAYASLQCDDITVDPDTGKDVEEHPDLAKGKALGKFRSSGQLGRAIGPLLGTCISLPHFALLAHVVAQHARPTGPSALRLPMGSAPLQCFIFLGVLGQ